jgi:hypothetical protein
LYSFQASKRFATLQTSWNKLLPMLPPPTGADVAILHTVKQLYSLIYQTGNKLNKRDKLGIHAHIENIALLVMTDIIHASLIIRTAKQIPLENSRTQLEVLKHLVRTEYELKIIDQKTYISIETLIIENSKQVNGWLKYITQNQKS